MPQQANTSKTANATSSPKPQQPKPKPQEPKSHQPKNKTNKVVRKPPLDKSQLPVDFILTYDLNYMHGENLRILKNFIAHLEQDDFILQTELFPANEDICFIKIFVPRKVILEFADVLNIELAYRNMNFKPGRRYLFKCMVPEINAAVFTDPLYQRARYTVNDARPRNLTSAEKSLIIYKIMKMKHFGTKLEERGVEKLLYNDILESAYPLHDGPYEWQERGPLNIRQLLGKYWGNFRSCWKYQPLDLIEIYYGPETAFYFAWLGFYNKMLLPAAIVGVICFFIGWLTSESTSAQKNEEICNSDKILCPQCHVKTCHYEYLRSSCFYGRLTTILDNPVSIAFAIFMAVWATVFIECWKRQEAILKLTWNLRNIEFDMSMRPEYEENTPYRRFSSATGTFVPYIPLRIILCTYTMTFGIIGLSIVLVLLALFGVMVYIRAISVLMVKNVENEFMVKNSQLIAACSGSTISIYHRIARWLTDMENPRTQIDYDNSFIYKSYALAFVNNYAVTFYIAFVKGNLYTHPGDKALYTKMAGVGSVLCAPVGCTIDLAIQLCFVMIIKNIFNNFYQFIFPPLIKLILKFLKQKKKGDFDFRNLPQWQQDYLLIPYNTQHIIHEYKEMMIQYGFVIFFVACFPFTPLLALMNNVLELRVDAMKFVKSYQRPIAIKVSGLGAWNGILQAVTYIGVVTNAFVIAFTSESVPREIFRHTVNWNLDGYIDSRLSAFDTKELPEDFTKNANLKNVSVCYYPGVRYPHDHPRRYHMRDEYWYEFAIKMIIIIVFEHTLLVLTELIAYAVPDIPFSVKEEINHEKNTFRDLRVRVLAEAYAKNRKRSGSEITLADINSVRRQNDK